MPATFAPRLVISSPDTYLASVPHLLGFTPTDSIVLTGIASTPSGRDEITLVQRFDLPPADIDAASLRDIARCATTPIARTGADQVIVAVISDKAYASPDDLPHRELVDELVESFDDAGISTRDSLYTDGTSRWSYGCFDEACCPSSGRVIPSEVRTYVAAEFAAAGVAVASSRDDLAAELTPAGSSSIAVVAQHLDALPTPGTGLEQWRDESIQHIHEALAGGTLPDATASARVIAGLDDIRVRDTVLWDLAQRGPTPVVTANLAEVVRTAPEGRVAPVATVLAIQHWTAGDGARANVALDRAHSADPDYSLAGLVETSLHTGLPPATWREAMSQLTRTTCRHGEHAPAAAPEPVTMNPGMTAPGLAAI